MIDWNNLEKTDGLAIVDRFIQSARTSSPESAGIAEMFAIAFIAIKQLEEKIKELETK